MAKWLRQHREEDDSRLLISKDVPKTVNSKSGGFELKFLEGGSDEEKLKEIVDFHNLQLDERQKEMSVYHLDVATLRRLLEWGEGRVYYLTSPDNGKIVASLVLTFFNVIVGDDSFTTPDKTGCVSYAIVDHTKTNTGLLMELVSKMAVAEHGRGNIRCYFGGLKPLFKNSIPFEMYVRCLNRKDAKKMGFAFDLPPSEKQGKFSDKRAVDIYERLWFTNPRPSSVKITPITTNDQLQQALAAIRAVSAEMKWFPSEEELRRCVANTCCWMVDSHFVSIHKYQLRHNNMIQTVSLLAYTTSYDENTMKAAFWLATEEGASVIFVPGLRGFGATLAKGIRCYSNVVTYINFYNSGIMLEPTQMSIIPL